MPYEPPEELIQLKVDWYAAQAEAERIGNEPNAGDKVIDIKPRHAGEELRTLTLPSDDQIARREQARERLRALTMEIHRHSWKRQQDNVHKAEKELNRIALERYQATLAA